MADLDLAALKRMTPAEHLKAVERTLNLHINACPSSPERNALTAANIILMEQQSGKRAS